MYAHTNTMAQYQRQREWRANKSPHHTCSQFIHVHTYVCMYAKKDKRTTHKCEIHIYTEQKKQKDVNINIIRLFQCVVLSNI